ncbi:MAG TPA: TlpA disulfide reductase family protein [Kofleriaceae bacterium]|nr:TlpA disulfide reductase family protein [Kofleriaceae bacterium]
MTFGERIGAAIVRPSAALATAGDRKHAGRSGSDLLVMMLVLLVATQLRALTAAIWLGIAVDPTLGVRAVVSTLTDSLVVDLGFLVVGAVIIFAASGRRRELGRAFDFACVAALPLILVALAASLIVYSTGLDVPRPVMWMLSGIAYAWAGGLMALACALARRPSPAVAGTKLMRRAGWGVLVVALAGIFVQVLWITGHVERVRPMTQGDPAPAFALPTITAEHQLGPPFTLDSARGHVVVLDFWATWCGPCLRAMPKLDALARAHPDVVVVAINIDDPAQAWSIFAERKYAMTLLAGDRETSDRYGVSAIPHTVVIDREGRVRAVFRGGAANLERQVTALLK